MAKNNPLNIRYSSFNHWLGQDGESKGFCTFESFDFGIRAGLILLCRTYRYQGRISIRKIIERFAPTSENNTEDYISYVSMKSSISPDVFISELRQYCRIISAMCQYESGFIISAFEVSSIAKEFDIRLRKLR